VGELAHDQAAAGAQHAAELEQALGGLGEVAQAEGDGDHVDAGVVQGELEGVGGHVPARDGAPEHLLGEVHADDQGPRGQLLQVAGQGAGAAGDVDGDLVVGQAGGAGGGLAPGLVLAEGEDGVGQVVAGGDAVEHPLDALGGALGCRGLRRLGVGRHRLT
jgi:hypothetical protein